MAATKFSKIQWGDGLTVTPDTDDPTVIRVDAAGGAGADGTDGTDGVGVPTGGSTGQVLTKVSGTDFDTDWETPTGGGGGAPSGAAGGALDGSYPNPGIAASVAGAGLAETSNVLSVNVDGSTLEISSDTLRIKDAGITGAKLGTVNLDDLADVQVPSPTDEQALTWDSSAGKWVPKTAVLHVDANAKGDLFAASANDVVARLAVGSNGQVLTADSSQTTGMKWAAVPGGGLVAVDTIWDAKGDLAVGTAADTAARLPVGSNDQVLVADSAQTTGVKWGPAPAGSGGAMTLLTTVTLGSQATFDVSSISGAYNDLLLALIVRCARASATDTVLLRLNNDSGSNYNTSGTSSTGSTVSAVGTAAATSINLQLAPGTTAAAGMFAMLQILIPGYSSTTWTKSVQATSSRNIGTAAGNAVQTLVDGFWNSTAAVNRVTVLGSATANLEVGSQLRIYGIT